MENKTQYTPEQQEVINSRGKNLLVSAAAGSGKTTVMIERIKDLIIKENMPVESFLVVTFTKASSIDMKAKLISKLSSEQPTPFLIEQIDNISTADVSTLHSFCAKLLKTYFYEAGLDPAFVVLSDEETSQLKEKALNALFDGEFESGNKDFFTLLDVLQKNRSDSELKKSILKLYEFFNVIFDKDKWFEKSLKSLYSTDLNKNQACNIINSYVSGRISKILEEVNNKIAEFNELKLQKSVEYLQNMQSELLKVQIRNGFIKNAINIYEIPNFGVPPKEEPVFEQYTLELKDFRTGVNKEITNLKKNFISNDINVLKEELSVAQKLATTLYNATLKFSQIYSQLKTEKGGLDYNDLEQYTLKVLESQEILNSLKEKYKYIFVDEYQDINTVQEKIISLLSNSNNRFMVGDIKQSIYRFRLCDPDIFLEKYNKYKTDDSSKAIDLFENFRSNEHILNFVNMIFINRMTKEFGGVDYKDGACLKAGGKPFYQEDPVTLCYIDTQSLESESKKDAEESESVYSVKEHQQLDELENLKSKAEANYIASEILDLVANKTVWDSKTKTNRPIRFKDIAILIPARNDFLDSLIEIFESYSIPFSTDASQDVLKDEYVKCIYNYLKLIYNKKQDIELFSVLYSPLSNFSLNELSQLRINNPNCKFFYQCLTLLQDNNKINAKLNDKISKFNLNLNKYRNIAKYKTAKQLAIQIIADYSIENLILTEADGKQRWNLMSKFIESLPETDIYEYFANNDNISITAEKAADANAVQIVTIHKSKGLEYPVAFVANIGRQFNMQSFYGNMLISKELGLGIDYFNNIERYKNTTLAKEAIKLAETRKMMEEQQRLLYVALTRAINKLYVVGCRNLDKIHASFPERQSSFADWFDEFVCKYQNDESFKNLQINVIDAANLVNNVKNIQKNDVILGSAEENIQKMVKDSICFEYANKKQTQMPQKTSVTQIASGYHESEEEYSRYHIVANASSIEKGNAYHKLMQYIDFSSNTIEKLNDNINKLLHSGQITLEELAYINKQSILKLLNNSMFIDLVSAGKVLREKEFFMNISNSGIQIVQGVVDLAVISGSEGIIADYKTGKFSNPQALQKYKEQLNIYAKAMEKSFNIKIKGTIIIGIEQGELFYI